MADRWRELLESDLTSSVENKLGDMITQLYIEFVFRKISRFVKSVMFSPPTNHDILLNLVQ